jgi:hypothetical protein
MINPPQNKAITRGEVKSPPCVPEQTTVVIVSPAPIVFEVVTDGKLDNDQ